MADVAAARTKAVKKSTGARIVCSPLPEESVRIEGRS